MRRRWSVLVSAVLLAAVLVACLTSCGSESVKTTQVLDPEIFGIHQSNMLGKGYDETYGELRELGARWVRASVPWAKVEPEDGAFDWVDTDRMFAAASKHGLGLLVTIRAISPWGSSRTPANWTKPGYHAGIPPKDMAQYEEFVSAFVGRYADRKAAWQIDNEPNAKAFWDGTRDEYLALLEAGYAAAHRADSDAVVLPAGLACGFSRLGYNDEKEKRFGEWFSAILDTGAYDAIDSHDYYPVKADNPWGITFGEYIDWHLDLMKERGVDKPLWMSEAGVPSEPITISKTEIGYTPAEQAAGLEDLFEVAASKGIARVFWLKLVDTDEYGFSTMGLMTRSLAQKPAYDMYKKLAGGE